MLIVINQGYHIDISYMEMGDSLVWKYNAEPSFEELVAQFQAPLNVMIGPLLKIAHSPEILSLLPKQRPPYRIVDPKVVERGINMTALWKNPWTAALAPGDNTAGIDIPPADSRYKHTAPAQSQTEREVQHTVSQHNAAALIQGRTEEEDQPKHLHDDSAAPTQAQTDGVYQSTFLHHNTTTLTQAQTNEEVSSRKRKFVLCNEPAAMVLCSPNEDPKLTLSQGHRLAKKPRTANQIFLRSRMVTLESV